MGRFFRGFLVGMGIGLLVAPMRGEDMRQLLRERYVELRNSLPDNEQLKQAGQQFAAGVSQTASQVKDYTQQAVSKVKDTGSSSGELTQQATEETSRRVKQTGADAINSIR
jgi:gas vesicle protein